MMPSAPKATIAPSTSVMTATVVETATVVVMTAVVVETGVGARSRDSRQVQHKTRGRDRLYSKMIRDLKHAGFLSN